MKSATKKIGFAATMLAGLIAAAVGTARAHHGFAVFDTNSQKTIVGTVKEFQWTNPHTWVWVDVTNDKGGVDTWGFEGMSPNFLGRRGWSRNTLKPGDKITISVFPSKIGTPRGLLAKVVLNGKAILDDTGRGRQAGQ